MLNQFVVDHVNASTPGQYYLAGFLTAMLIVAICVSISAIAGASAMLYELNRSEVRYRARRGLAPMPTYWQVLSADVKTVTAPFVGAFLWVVIGPDAVGDRLDGVKRAGVMVARLSTAVLSRLFTVALIAGISHQIGGHK